ncbi:FAD/NAD(P)-binding protein [Brevibacterium ammoniilyticum]|uniref:FAD/NAD(P)-binding protein n=1 Tax=Brevibacterium ammoniilyticum TaxID=1046555 RepID=A0ABP9TYA2_9MICO
MTAHSHTAFDVVIIGAGIAGSSTLLELLSEHQAARPQASVLRVAVVERSGDHYGGVPYGSTRSGSSSLIVTPLRDFLPADLLSEFVTWLSERTDDILAGRLRISQAWVDEHASEIRRGDWESLFVPRRLFGIFFDARVRAAISEASDVEVVEIQGEACDLYRREGMSSVTVRTSDEEFVITSRVVVLALGSPPKRALAHEFSEGGVGLLIEDTHAGDLDELLDSFRSHMVSLPPEASRDVLIVGANADALELLHAVHRWNFASPWDRRVIVLAPHGTPNTWSVRPDRTGEYRSRRLARYLATTTDEALTSAGIYAGVEADVIEAIGAGYSEQDTVPELKRLVDSAIDRLSLSEQLIFVHVHGNLINRFSRPTGGDYQRVAADLLARHRIEVVTGRFVHSSATQNGWIVTVTDDDNAETWELEKTFGLIVNCSGFESLANTSDPLLRRLQQRDIVTVASSHHGFVVDEGFRAAPGLFVAGPLLAGNLNDRLRVWHLESCRRVLDMATDVAASVVAELRRGSAESDDAVRRGIPAGVGHPEN